MQIAKCAYDIYIEHGRVDGRSDQNWLQAEEELAQNAQAAAHKSAVDRRPDRLTHLTKRRTPHDRPDSIHG